jgi:lipopolysaccharide export system protein LptA
MTLRVYRIRRWLAVIAAIFTAVVAGMYFSARMRQHSALKDVPGKISYDVKQTVDGFQFSKSDAGRTVFTIRAKSVKEFKLNGRAELHDVSITLYGRDTSRFDRIYGDDFSYDPKTGEVLAKGEVQIDLEANPAGLDSPDQSVPQDLKNPVHLKTRDLVFNRETGDASTGARADFTMPQAAGWAVGVRYAAKTETLTLDSQIHVTLSGGESEALQAAHGTITREPREIVLDRPAMRRESGRLQADQATFFLGRENEVQRVLARGHVNLEPTAEDEDQGAMRARADQADLRLAGKRDLLRTATLTGNVHVERGGGQPVQGDAGSAVLDFRGRNELQKVHAANGVHLAQHGSGGASTKDGAAPQDFDLDAPTVDFFLAAGRRLDHAQTSGPSQITLAPAQPAAASGKKPTLPGQRTIITAARFEAKFEASFAPDGKESSRLTSVHGAPGAKIVSLSPGEPDRVSTSQTVDAIFLPQGGIASITQQGSFAYFDGQPAEKRTQAWADKALYTPGDRMLVLTGRPRVTDGGMTTTANTVRIDRASNDAFADGNVKSTYNDVKLQPNGALLASSSPIHVTAATMTAHNSPAIAVYQGNVRLWQDANVIEAPSLQFDRDRRSLVAQGTATQRVTTVLVQAEKSQLGPPGSAPPSAPSDGENKAKIKKPKRSPELEFITLTSGRLTYSDAAREAHYEGDVRAQGNGFEAAADQVDIFFSPRVQDAANNKLKGSSQLDRMVARGHVSMAEPERRATCETLVYTSSEDKFVLTGGPPSIFDAERGRVTGGSLTFFRADDRVLVEGKATDPVVTQTRVAQ